MNVYYESSLAHHGVKGMHWGVIRTPEQLGHAPSKSAKKKSSFFSGKKKEEQKQETEEQRKARIEARKKAVLSTRSAQQLYDNANLFTTDELKAAHTRLKLEKDIQQLEPAKVKKGAKIVDGFQNASKIASSTQNIFKQGTEMYNLLAKTVNAFSGANWPIIGGNGNGNPKPPNGGGNAGSAVKNALKELADDVSNDLKSEMKSEFGKGGATGVKGMRWGVRSIVGDGDAFTDKSSKNSSQTVDADWHFDTIYQPSAKATKYVDNTMKSNNTYKVSGLLSSGKVQTGQNIVAGYLEAPK